MKAIPKYIIDILQRSKYEFDLCKKSENYAAGYTLRIAKARPYTRVETFRTEMERLCKWVNKQYAETAYILQIPVKTHWTEQIAVVTIFDPVMQRLEGYLAR